MVHNGSLNMYADDATLYSEGNTVANAVGKLEADAQLTLEWLKHNNLIGNLCDEQLQPQVVTTSLGRTMLRL